MSSVLLKQGSATVLAAASNAPANGAIVSTVQGTMPDSTGTPVTDDVTPHADEVRIDVSYTGGTIGEVVNIYVAQANFAATEVEGNVTASDATVPADALPNLGVPIPIISQDTNASRGSGVFRVTTAKFIVVIENATALIGSLVITATPLNYESVA